MQSDTKRRRREFVSLYRRRKTSNVKDEVIPMNPEQKNIDAIAAYFEAGCKSCVEKRVGIETEHFVLNDQGEPVTYEILDAIMQELVQEGDVVVEEDGHFLGYYNEEFSITLEPAAQLEISVMPQKSVADMERILKRFYKEYGDALLHHGYHLVHAGYHPTRLAGELSLIPKKRYEYMDAYFRHSGSRGYQMMRGTASTQVSVDYLNEADFVKKYRLACALVPVFSLITENSPVYEGKRSPRFLTRSYVWQDVDSIRCLIPDSAFRADFGFRAYAAELYGKPPILVKEGSLTRSTNTSTLAEWYKDKELTLPEIEHLISMFFPDVRLKQYLEIRPADSLPMPLALAYAELVRGIFYRRELLDFFADYFSGADKQNIEAAKNELMEKGYQGIVYGRPVAEVTELLFEKVLVGADESERERMRPLYELVKRKVTPAEVLWKERV